MNFNNIVIQSIESVELFISKNLHGNINSVDKYGKTLLRVACEQGHTEIVKLLLEYGAFVDMDVPYLREFEYLLQPIQFAMNDERGHIIEGMGEYNQEQQNLMLSNLLARMSNLEYSEDCMDRDKKLLKYFLGHEDKNKITNITPDVIKAKLTTRLVKEPSTLIKQDNFNANDDDIAVSLKLLDTVFTSTIKLSTTKLEMLNIAKV